MGKVIQRVFVVLVVFSAVDAYAQQEACDEFPTRVTDYYFESWFRAEKTLEQVLKGQTAKPNDINKAIIELRRAVSNNKTSGKGKDESGRQFDYYPYFALAMLENARGRMDCVGILLTLERSNLPAKYQTHATGLRENVQAYADARIYRDLTTQVDQLIKTNLLSPSGARKGREVVALGGNLQTPSRSDLQAIAFGIIDLGVIESDRVLGFLSEVNAAIPEALNGLTVSHCNKPSPSEQPEQLKQVVAQITNCLDVGVQALATGGRDACAALRSQRDSVTTLVGRLKSIDANATATQPAELPAACNGNASWAKTDLDELNRSFSGLDFVTTKATYVAQASGYERQIDQSLEIYRAGLQTQEDRIFLAKNACRDTLALSGANRTLGRLRDRIKSERTNSSSISTLVGNNISGDVDNARKELARQVIAGVDRLLSQKQAMAGEGVDVTSFVGLETARGNLSAGDITKQSLAAVCDAANKTEAVVSGWLAANIPVLQDKVRASRWFLTSASNLTDGNGVPCVGPSLEALPSNRPPASPVKWARTTNAAVMQASACLDTFRESRGSWIGTVTVDLQRSVDALAALDGLEGLSRDRMQKMRGELEGSLAGLSRARKVLDLPTGTTADQLRAELHDAGVEASDASWNFLGKLQDAEKDSGQQVIRDEATAPLIAVAADTVSRWSGIIGQLGAFSALNSAYNRFAAGELDHAIVGLREWTPDDDVDSEVAGLRHATLAYFLHTKWSLLPEAKRQQAVGDLLYNDATVETQAALRGNGELNLPWTISDDSFQQFVANCCM